MDQVGSGWHLTANGNKYGPNLNLNFILIDLQLSIWTLNYRFRVDGLC